MNDDEKLVAKGILLVLFIAVLIIGGCNSYETVSTGHQGVKTSFGKIEKVGLEEGIHFFTPFVGNRISQVDLRVLGTDGEEPTFTKDNQEVNVKYTVNFRFDPKSVEFIYRNGGVAYFNTVAPAIIKGVMKEVVGQFDAETIVSKRAKVNDDVQREIAEKLLTKFIILENFEVTNFAFDPEYQKAIEAKMIATQKAKEAENRTAEFEQQKKQAILTAQGQAEAMRIKSEALAQNKNLVEYEWVNKWKGDMPQTLFIGNGQMPMINLGPQAKK